MYKNIILILIINAVNIFAATDTIFYNADWQKSNKNQAEYFRTIEKKDDGRYFVEDHYINGDIQMRGFYKDLDPEIKHGPFTFFDKSGRMTEFGYYKNGIKDGKYEFYYKNGQVEFHENWKNGKLHGDLKAYQEDGTIQMEGKYKNGERIGKWKYYDYFGKLEHERFYQKNINVIPAGISFTFPNDEWYAATNKENENKLKFNFKRTALELNEHELIKPLISVIIDKNDNEESLAYYASTRVTAFNIKIIKDVSSKIKIKNSLAYLIEYNGKDGTKLKGYLAFIPIGNKINQIYLETTKDTFYMIDNELMNILSSVKRYS